MLYHYPASPRVQFHHKYKIIVWMKYRVDPDQLSSSEASQSVFTVCKESTLFKKIDIILNKANSSI